MNSISTLSSFVIVHWHYAGHLHYLVQIGETAGRREIEREIDVYERGR
jgi:hypothetical protein